MTNVPYARPLQFRFAWGMLRTMRRVLWALLGLACVAAASAEPAKIKLHVLPVAFSKESQKTYQAWIERLRAQGFGNAIWQEIEDVAYDDERFSVIQDSVGEEEFLRILSSREKRVPEAGSAEAAPSYELPDHVLTINLNFFIRSSEKLRGMTATKSEEFSVALYVRYYDLAGGALNIAVPAQADAVGPDPISAARQAVRAAWGKLLKRLEAQNRIPVRAPVAAKPAK